MNRDKNRATLRRQVPRLALLLLLTPGLVLAQVPVDEDGVPLDAIAAGDATPAYADAAENDVLLTAGELSELVGPVALYPDDLLAIVLPASTYPLEIVQAARFLEQLEADASLQPDESWDESVVALLNYPEVVEMMDDDIDWTWRLGEAVISQQEQLIAAIEDFRDQAYAAGNLKTDEYQTVSNNDGAIEIEPVNDEIIYVPYYEPSEVVVYQPRTVYYYYPRAYPVYYYPYPAGYRFSSAYFWGVTTAFTIGWHNDYLHVYHPTYWGHPYYGHHYYSHYYRRPSINVYNTWYVNNNLRHSAYRYRDGDYWRPRYRSGSRPHEQRVRNYHYPSSERSASRQNVRSTRQQLDGGRMNLALRDRSGDTGGRNNLSAKRRDASVTNGAVNKRGSRNTSAGGSGERLRVQRTSRDRNAATQRRTGDVARRSTPADSAVAPSRQRVDMARRESATATGRQSGADRQRRTQTGAVSRPTTTRSAPTRRETVGRNAGNGRAAVQRPAVEQHAAASSASSNSRRSSRQATARVRTPAAAQAAQNSGSRGESKSAKPRRQENARTRNRERKYH